MSVALYRKYRSATFAELIGQEHVSVTLRNEIVAGTVAHAYLLAGIRGTGKTSAARILAKAVNCLDLDEGEPCNQCTACREVAGGGSVDVLEIDAASNRGIDEMRELRERVRFLPAMLRRKVYIVDEAHMLTTEAWNAFLKTLEEPPPHVLFVLATTEPHKVPETVRSRVQRFDFRRVGVTDLTAHLAMLAGREGVEVERAALDLLAVAAQGSVRDALSLLDQALSMGQRPVTMAGVRTALGLADPAVMRALVSSLPGGEAAGALRAVAAAFDAGADARQLLRELGRLARAIELTRLGCADVAGILESEVEVCRGLARTGYAGFWVDVLDRVVEAEVALRQPVDARLQVELCLLRLATARPAVEAPGGVDVGALVDRLAELERAVRQLQPRPSQQAAEAGKPPPDGGATPQQSSNGAISTAVQPAPTSPHTETGGLDLAGWTARWPQVIAAVKRRNPLLAGVLRGCAVVAAVPGTLSVEARGFHFDQLKARLDIVSEAVSELAGEPWKVDAVARRDSAAAVAAAGTPGTGPGDEPTDRVLATFPGSRRVGQRLVDPSGPEHASGREPGR